MTTEIKRFALSALVFGVAVAAAVSITPTNAQASSSSTSPVRIMDSCPNPAPYWCDSGSESDRCADGDLDWRGCKDSGGVEQ